VRRRRCWTCWKTPGGKRFADQPVQAVVGPGEGATVGVDRLDDLRRIAREVVLIRELSKNGFAGIEIAVIVRVDEVRDRSGSAVVLTPIESVIVN